jgi:hypothetical protein
VQEIKLMEAPRRYSVSPLPSYATIPTRRVTSFTESLRLIWRWLRGVGPDWRERAREARIVDQVADLMAAEMEEDEAAEPQSHGEVETKSYGRG